MNTFQNPEESGTASEFCPFNLLIFDANSGACIFFSDPTLEMVGATEKSQLLGKNYHDYPDWEQAGLIAQADLALAENKITAVSFNHTTTFGKEISVECSFIPIEINSQKFLVLYVLDISKKAMLTQEIAKTKMRYRALFEKMLDAYALHEIVLDAQGVPSDYRFLEINSAFSEMTGLSREQVVGKTVLEAIPNLDKTWIQRYGEVALGGKASRFEQFEPNLNKYFEINAYSPEPMQFAVIFRDITEYKSRQAELAKQTAEVERLKKLLTDKGINLEPLTNQA